MHRPGKSVFIALVAVLLAMIGIWLWFIPKGYFGITSTIGYTFCHQDPARSPHAFGHSLALCYRCMGLFSGILIGAIWQIGQRKNARFTSKPILVFGGLALLFYAFDGLNASFLPELLSLKPLYQDQAWIRMLSGLLLGNVVAMVVIPLFNRVFFVNYNETPPADGVFRKFGIAVFDGLILFIFFNGLELLMLAANTMAILASLGILVLLYTMLTTVILKRNNLFHSLSEGWYLFLLGGIITMLQIGVITFLRYNLTGTWGWPFTDIAVPGHPFDSTGL